MLCSAGRVAVCVPVFRRIAVVDRAHRVSVVTQAKKRNYDWLDDADADEDEFELSGYTDAFYEVPAYEDKQEDHFLNGKRVLVNKEINAKEVRLLGQNKDMIGVVPLFEALDIAQEEGVDLILLSSEQNPPLCRLVTWSKYKYESEKTEKTKKKTSTSVELKEVRLRPTTDTNDLQVKLKSASKFLDKGNKVKLTMKFEGRELQYKDQGKEVLLKFIQSLHDVGRVEGPLNFKTGTYNVILSPVKNEAKVPS